MALPIKNEEHTLTRMYDAVTAVAAFVASRSPSTRRAYESDLTAFAGYVGAPSPGIALEGLLRGGPRAAFAAVTAYKAALRDDGLAAATINRRLASLRSFVRFARAAGLVNWVLEVENVKTQPYRDTRGPGASGVSDILEVLRRRRGAKAARDRAIVRLLYDLALRRGELTQLDVGDVDLSGGVVRVYGKGRTEKEERTLPPETAAALDAWLDARGRDAGPLFINFDRAGKGGRLTGAAVYYVVKYAGKKAGYNVTPHGLRHAAITEALDKTGGDVRAVQKYSRHRDLETLTVYDDTRRDLAGDIAKIVAAGVPK